MANVTYEPNLTTERGRHLHWCKVRAFEYLDRDIGPSYSPFGPAYNYAIKENMRLAWLSFQSDMSKNEETANHAALHPLLGLSFMDSPQSLRRYIEGFN